MPPTTPISVPVLKGLASSYLGARSMMQAMRQADSRVTEPQDKRWSLFHESAEEALNRFLRIRNGSQEAHHPYASNSGHTNVALSLVGATPLQVQQWSQLVSDAPGSLLVGLNSSVSEAAAHLSGLIENFPREFGCLVPENNNWLRDVLAMGVSTYNNDPQRIRALETHPNVAIRLLGLIEGLRDISSADRSRMLSAVADEVIRARLADDALPFFAKLIDVASEMEIEADRARAYIELARALSAPVFKSTLSSSADVLLQRLLDLAYDFQSEKRRALTLRNISYAILNKTL